MTDGYQKPFDEVVLALVKKGGEPLSLRQYAILFTLENAQTDGERTVRYLAATLNIGKPAVTRGLDTLQRGGYIRRRRDEKDGRNVFVDIIRPDSEQSDGSGWLPFAEVQQAAASM